MRAARVTTHVILVHLAALLALSIMPAPAGAAWEYSGNPVVTEAGLQHETLMVEDGAGGFIVIWKDERYGSNHIYAQRFDGDGNALWATGGVPVCAVNSSKDLTGAVTDEAGGAVISWADYRAGNADIYLQRIGSGGTLYWTGTGVSLCSAPENQLRPLMVPDGTGGAVVVWEDFRDGDYFCDIYARKITGGGILPWPTVWGEPVVTSYGLKQEFQVLSDGAGGTFICWEDIEELKMTWIDTDGNIIGAANGWYVCSAYDIQIEPVMVRVNSVYHAVVWRDYRDTYNDIYIQLYDGDTEQLAADGQLLSRPGGFTYELGLAADTNGRVIATWYDFDDGKKVFAQCYNFADGPVWPGKGISVTASTAEQDHPSIISDGRGGTIVCWRDSRYGVVNPAIYAQRFDGDGNRLWDEDGVQVSSGGIQQFSAVMMEDGRGGAFIAFNDYVSSTDYDICAQRLDVHGYIASPEPAIGAAVDVPGDQGGYAEVRWAASYLDPAPFQEISYYSIWRSISPATAVLMSGGGSRMIEDLSLLATTLPGLTGAGNDLPESGPESPGPDPDRPVIRIERLPSGDFYWELIDTQVAQYYDLYSRIVPTSFDSTSVNTDYHYFQVAAHTADPLVVFTSSPDSCRTTDDLSPAMPYMVVGEQEYAPEGLRLSWEPNTEADLGGYLVHRSIYPTFQPNSATYVARITEAEYFDDSWQWEDGYWYRIAAFDIHQNVSDYATFGPSEVTGEDLPGVPRASYLAQNYPNPFNPSTTIAFGLSRASHVKLKIYDTSGRLVRVVLDEDRDAGRYAASWDGLNSRGMPVASGIYYYRLIAHECDKTCKMILLR